MEKGSINPEKNYQQERKGKDQQKQKNRHDWKDRQERIMGNRLLEGRTLHDHQDTVFGSLYSDPERVLDLYFVLHPEERSRGITPDQVKLVTLKNAFLVQRHNDVAFLIGDRLIVLVEHQSTINENMPLRMLFYVADEYEKVIASFKKKLFLSVLQRIISIMEESA